MAGNDPYVDEFLYRGRAPGSSEDPAWHLVIGAIVTNPFSQYQEVVTSSPMNMQQATAAGWTLPAIIADINAQMLAQNEQLQSTVGQLNDEIATLQDQLTAAAATIAQQQAAIEGRDMQISKLQTAAADAKAEPTAA